MKRRNFPFLAFFTAMLLLALAPVPLHAQSATDQTLIEDGQNARVVRLSVNKSAVVRLPAIAKDVLIGNPGVVDAVIRSSNIAYLFARAPGQTNIFFFDASGRQISSLDIEVTRDPSALQRLITRSLPDSNIKVDAVGESLILSGIAKNGEAAAQAVDLAGKVTGDPKLVVSAMTIAGKEQVMLKVRVAEMQRSLLKQLGLDSDFSVSSSKLPIRLITSNPFANAAATGSSLTFGLQSGTSSIEATLKALEKQGLLRTLAEPTLTAITGESAKFLAGGEYPVPTSSKNGEVQVNFKSFGVGLGFTPVVLSEGRISLKISTEVSELTNEGAVSLGVSGLSIPGLKVRRAETAVEMPSGGSMVMAGLIQDSQKQEIKGMTGLKDIPVLGQLFRSRDFQTSQTELVVIVTPYVVEPVAARELATPIDTLAPPSSAEANFFGHLNRVYGQSGAQGTQARWRGQIGYIVE